MQVLERPDILAGYQNIFIAITLIVAMFMGCTFNAMNIISEKEDGVALVLSAGYQDADVRSAAYETQKQQYLEKGKTEEEAASLAADIQPPAECNDHGTGYAADILSTDYPTRDTGFDTTRAYEWLTAYAAEYGFILRYPQDRQAATGVVFEPWHWRYVGVENALAIRASGLSLEEFLALQKAS